MAWIHVTSEEGAEGLLKEAYERIKRALGRVIPYYRAYSVSPRLLHAHLDFYGAVGAPGAHDGLKRGDFLSVRGRRVGSGNAT